ncbi:hypothetical protein B4080_6320 [Bacillus cereus]|nr:hypothetical protein B4080_6320 [Bacillus cereus]
MQAIYSNQKFKIWVKQVLAVGGVIAGAAIWCYMFSVS